MIYILKLLSATLLLIFFSTTAHAAAYASTRNEQIKRHVRLLNFDQSLKL